MQRLVGVLHGGAVPPACAEDVPQHGGARQKRVRRPKGRGFSRDNVHACLFTYPLCSTQVWKKEKFVSKNKNEGEKIVSKNKNEVEKKGEEEEEVISAVVPITR